MSNIFVVSVFIWESALQFRWYRHTFFF